MNRNKHLRIVIAQDGTCSVDAMHFTGPACQIATREVTDLLGGTVTRQQLKPEARFRESDRERQKEGA